MPTLSLATGIITADGFAVFFFFGLLILIALVFLAIQLSQKLKPVALILLFFGLGGVIALFRFDPPLDSQLAEIIQRSEKNVFQGTLREIRPSRLQRTKMEVSLFRVKQQDHWKELKGTIQLSAESKTLSALPPFLPGDTIIFQARLKEPHSFHNPGSFDTARFLRRKGIQATGFLSGPDQIMIMQNGASKNPLTQTIGETRAKIQGLIAESSQGEAGALLRALVIGDQSSLSKETEEIFQRLGLTHLLSISGVHVGMVATTLFFIGLFLLRRSYRLTLQLPTKKMAAGLSFLPVLFYVLLAGSPPSASRAGIMVGLYLLSLLISKEQEPWNTLSAAALLLLAWDPELLFERSFQLSFLAMIGLTFVLTTESLSKRNRFLKYLLISLATLLMTAPLASGFSKTFSLAGLLCNFWAIPFVGFGILPPALLGAFLGLPFPGAGLPLLQISGKISEIFLKTLSLVSPGMKSLVWPVSLTNTELCLFYLFLFLLGWGLIERKRLWPASISFLIFISFVLHPFSASYFQKDLRLTFLDVGEGDATLVEFPHGKKWLVDAGGYIIPPDSPEKQPFDMGENVLLPYLLQQKIYHLDKIILSHPHPDHYGGMAAIVKTLPVGEVWMTEATFPHFTFATLMEEIRQKGIPVRQVASLQKPFTEEGVRVEIVYPSFIDRHRSINDNSLVFKLTFGEVSFLLTGDIEKKGEAFLAAQGRFAQGWFTQGNKIQSTILKVPHHGSNSSSSVPFLELVKPQLAVISVGWKNPFHFPRPEVLERYRERGIPVYRTDKNGAVIVETDGKTTRIKKEI
ncbi:MAG: DNA internalization-related competence protein ComEC/Rec2 [Deltaproteobacteria bacterium]|nr:DNA internalization-related competence protein ComEC/Rec2 [Deltaproteobacteria bacterium]